MADKETENTVKQTNRSISHRECEADGKLFTITRYFEGERALGDVMTEIAARMANRETE